MFNIQLSQCLAEQTTASESIANLIYMKSTGNLFTLPSIPNEISVDNENNPIKNVDNKKTLSVFKVRMESLNKKNNKEFNGDVDSLINLGRCNDEEK